MRQKTDWTRRTQARPATPPYSRSRAPLNGARPSSPPPIEIAIDRQGLPVPGTEGRSISLVGYFSGSFLRAKREVRPIDAGARNER